MDRTGSDNSRIGGNRGWNDGTCGFLQDVGKAGLIWLVIRGTRLDSKSGFDVLGGDADGRGCGCGSRFVDVAR